MPAFPSIRRGRRRFDHLVEEICLAVGGAVPRYRLWLLFHELGCDPEALTQQQAVSFCGRPLARFLAGHGHRLRRGAQRRLQRSVGRYDPTCLTAYERLEGMER